MMPISHHVATREIYRRTQHERGYIVAMLGLLLVPLLLMVGLSVDVGYWYNRASEVQKAADAAALAGVVFLPNVGDAETHARIAGARNGFDWQDGDVTMSVEPAGERRLRVTLTEHRVGSFFFASVGGRTLDITRSSMAQYVTPVPMGSPRNYFGTGRLLNSNPELLFQAINSYCTNKVQGDRHQSHLFSTTNDNRSSGVVPAPNPEYRSGGYELYIDAPEGRSADIEVRLYDARFNTSSSVPTPPVNQPLYPATSQGDGCTWSRVTSPTTDHLPMQTISGPRYWRAATSGTWNLLPPGHTAFARQSQRAQCTPTGPDLQLGGSAHETYTYSLYGPDDTPFDDSDNPLICTRDFTNNTPFEYSYLGSPRWNTLCNIPRDARDGQYILRVRNSGEVVDTHHSNSWGVVARYTDTPPTEASLCDGRYDDMCPRVYGKEAISVYANTTLGTASFFLAEIPEEHSGKQLRIELWDPGEGGSRIRFMQPSGTEMWGTARFDWRSFNDDGSVHRVGESDVDEIDVTGDLFNGKVLEITVDLTGYEPPADNEWWKIEYEFNNPARPEVTDRTTWSARVIGDPVHLVEED